MEIDLKDCRLDWLMLSSGLCQVMVFNSDTPMPKGFVWGLLMNNNDGGKCVFQVFHSYVMPEVRRNGIRTMLNKCSFENYEADVIVTSTGSKEGGSAFLEKSGYKRDEYTGEVLWEYESPRKEDCLVRIQ